MADGDKLSSLRESGEWPDGVGYGDEFDVAPPAEETWCRPFANRASRKDKSITEINTLTPEEVKAEMELARTGRRRYFRFRHRTATGDVRCRSTAARCCPNGGTVTLATARCTVRALDASPVPPGRWVTLCVADDGHGMDEETLAHVFEPFFTTKTSGRGLAIVHGIVTSSGGYINIDSQPDRGARFTVYLPRA